MHQMTTPVADYGDFWSDRVLASKVLTWLEYTPSPMGSSRGRRCMPHSNQPPVPTNSMSNLKYCFANQSKCYINTWNESFRS